MHFASALATILPFVAASYAVHVNVTAGVGGPVYNPSNITAAAGDVIDFHFTGPQTATQVTFAAPCTPVVGGFNSGTEANGTVYSLTVNDTKPIWISCQIPGHCQAGMVFSVNAPLTGNMTYAKFLAAAKATASNTTTTGSPSSATSSGSPSKSTTTSSKSSANTQASVFTFTTASFGIASTLLVTVLSSAFLS
ncbi:hypothetical protein DL93DRAFT_186187 [Clavulina sp. PMI_390]|nr:hypothetical protein DL93DRAFT_186187 [Clavulina sp. PMI_390]